jgi:hypothetical protein
MPKIQWERLPKETWAHLRDRAKERQISEEDLFELAEWKAQDPEAPDGDWYKDFGTFKLVSYGHISKHVPNGRTSGARQAIVTRTHRSESTFTAIPAQHLSQCWYNGSRIRSLWQTTGRYSLGNLGGSSFTIRVQCQTASFARIREITGPLPPRVREGLQFPTVIE